MLAAPSLNPRRIVIVPYGPGIGDLALQRGLFAAVARYWPQARVSVFAPRGSEWLLPEGVRLRSRVMGIGAWNRLSLERAWGILGPLEQGAINAGFSALPVQTLARWPAWVFRRRFDLVVDFLGAFTRAVDMGLDWLPTEESETAHIVDIMTDYLQSLGVHPQGSPAAVEAPTLRSDDADRAAELARSVAGARAVLINPHAGSSLKLPRGAFWEQLIELLRGEGISPLVVRGKGKADEERARRVVGGGGVLLPPESLGTLTALAGGCLATVSPDSGLLHLVALAGAPWVGLFGATNPYLLGPYDRSRGRLLIADPPRGQACLTCWQRFTVGSSCCPPYGDSCLSQLRASDAMDAIVGLAAAPVR